MNENLSPKQICIIVTLLLFIIGTSIMSGWLLGYRGIGMGQIIHQSNYPTDYARAFHIIDRNFYGNYNTQELFQKSMGALVSSLHDKHSVYLSPSQFHEATGELTNAISFQALDHGIGIITIIEFNGNTEQEFNTIKKTIQEQHISKLIVNLRGNPGGNVTSAIFLANQFLDHGIIFQEQTKPNSLKKEIQASRKAPFASIPIVILVDEKTASAAELFTAALQENNRATVIGQPTYGKGTEQEYFSFSDSSGMVLTTAYWFTPKGTWVEGKGITPNITTASLGEAMDKAKELLK